MPNKKNTTPRNYKGNADGWWEIYYPSGRLWFKGNFVNGKKVGFWFEYNEEFFYAD